jgi:undecaprenyl diphosphate synthase
MRLPTPPRSCERSTDVDLLIRSGGEKRLSDFLLWESAYAELCFVDTLWPDFGEDNLRAAIADFHRRERRFGALPTQALLVAAE